MKPIVTGSLVTLTVLSLTANALMYMRYSSSRPLVTVGNQVISKKAYRDALDYQTQGAVLKKMVLTALVNQAASRAGVEPTDAQVSARMASIRRSQPQLLTNINNDPVQLAAFTQDLKTQMALDNLRIKNASVSNAEVVNYYDTHKAQFTLPMQVQTELVVSDNSVDASTASTLLKQGIGLDVISRQPGLHVVGMDGFNINMQALPRAVSSEISNTVFHMKPGGVQTLHIGQSYLVLKVNKLAGAGLPPLSQIRPQVVRQARLAKAVPVNVEISTLYQQIKPQFAVSKYASYFDNISGSDSNQVASAQ